MNKPINPTDFELSDDTPALVLEAAKVVPPLWPLESAIAVNPLAGLEDLPFDRAVSEAAELFGSPISLPIERWRAMLATREVEQDALRDAAIAVLGGLDRAFQLLGPDLSALDLLMARLLHLPLATVQAPSPFAAADALIAKWCAAFFAEKVVNLMRNREQGLFGAVLPLLKVDPDFAAIAGAEGQALLQDIKAEPLVAIQQNLAAMPVSADERLPLLRRLVARLPGWAGHIRWRVEHAAPELVASAPATMADLLALWTTVVRFAPKILAPFEAPSHREKESLAAHFGLTLELGKLSAEGLRAFAAVAELSPAQLGLIFMRAAERGYRNSLVERIVEGRRPPVRTASRPDAQLVCCIDVRSEPLRRAIEEAGNYSTFGYAGFFGVPVAVRSTAGAPLRKQLPVLLRPAHEIAEQPAEIKRLGGFSSWQALMAALKDGLATTFTTAEASGLPAAAAMLARTFAPKLLRKRRSCGTLSGAIPLADRVSYARGLLTLTGMGTALAPLVVLVGHAGSATNNPYLSALHCGACGGHAGGTNARLLAAIMNDPEVRAALALEGLAIPEDTMFLAAEHDTTCDEVHLLDMTGVPPSRRPDVGKLERALGAATTACRRERAVLLNRSEADLILGAAHWGEVRPEWGLARNAAFIVGPRRLTEGLDLAGRAFLHSYDWLADTDGTALTTILTAPMVVAHWINCQYLFSTLDNGRFGAGDKVTHNVLGGIGVVQGNGGDLRVGLPRQSLFRDDGTPYHVPQRLLTIVYAPAERIETIIDAAPELQRLFDKEWVQLVCIDPVSGKHEVYVPRNLSLGPTATR